jgi:DNA repair protein RecN (Recombination protein N)
MLQSLEVHQYALIDHLRVEWGPGLTTLTGETGSGKSILLGALGLALGERADVSSIRPGAEKCWVEATFAATPSSTQWIEGAGLDAYPEITLRREIHAQGRSRAFINDTPVNLNDLRALAETLVDLHGQDDTRAYLHRERRLEWLDSFLKNRDVLNAYQAAWKTFQAAESRIQALSEETTGADPDYIQFQIAELDAIHVCDRDWAALEEQRSLLLHASGIRQSLEASLAALEGGSAEQSTDVLQALGTAHKHLASAVAFHPAWSPLADQLLSALVEIKEIARELQRESERIAEDPATLAQLEELWDALSRLQQKHRCNTPAELIALRQAFQNQWDRWAAAHELREQLSAEREAAQATLFSCAQDLTAQRRALGEELASKLAQSLKQLHLPHAQLKFHWNLRPKPDSWGQDEIEWLFSANPGSPPVPLHQVASGGERSRLMLAIKTLTEHSRVGTIVLDEIDTGVSGLVAEKMALTMKRMAFHVQVLAITHLPQVAAAGADHWEVSKTVEGNATRTHLHKLQGEGRVNAIAKMLSGSSVGPAALAHAQSLLQGLHSETPINSQ